MFRDGRLLYRRGDFPFAPLIPLSQTIFRVQGFDGFHLEIGLDASGNPVKVFATRPDGRRDETVRTGDAPEVDD